MPREVKAYACIWNCRRGVTTRKKDMLNHENNCKLNPTVRTCATCRHQGFDPGDRPDFVNGDPGSPGGWWCEINKMPDGVLMVRHCEYWEQKEATP